MQRRRAIAIVFTALVLLLPLPVGAQEVGAPPLTAADVETFFDGLIPAHMEAARIPGATVAVVANGETVLAKGYGLADVEQRIPVDGATTLFRPGSVSKLFTWTAVMQQVEQGRLDLDADVNSYLTAFQIPATFAEPITLAHLMAHTPGFEDQGEGLFVRTAEEMTPLEETLVTQIPARRWPPGRWSAYSNYGTALAGYIVQQVSGLPFEQYVEQNIFAPLGMVRSTFRQPLPPELAPGMAQGYRPSRAGQEAGPFEYISASPAGSMSTTAADMARFMLAHLGLGQVDGARILQEETARAMHAQHFTHDPRVSGFAHGFIEGRENGRRTIGHGGSTTFFQSQLTLLPEEGAGIFVSFNSAAAISTPDQVVGAFMDRYFPGAPAAPPQAQGGDWAAFAGSYTPTRANVSTPEKLLSLFGQLSIAAQADGSAAVTLAAPPISMRAVQVAPGVLRDVGVPPSGFGDVVLLAGEGGAPPVALVENFPIQAFVKAPAYATLGFALPLFAVLLLLCLSVIVGGPVAWWISRRYGERRTRRVRAAGWVLFALAATVIVYVAGAAIGFTDPDLVFGAPPWLTPVLLLAFVIAALTAAALVFAVLAWVKGDWGWVRRLHYSATAIAAAVFVWWLWYWRLLTIY